MNWKRFWKAVSVVATVAMIGLLIKAFLDQSFLLGLAGSGCFILALVAVAVSAPPERVHRG